MVYGKKAFLSIEFEYNTLRITAQFDLDVTTTQQERLLQLIDEFKMQAIIHTEVMPLQMEVWLDKHIKEKTFQKGDWALLYDFRFKYFKGKLMIRWLGPYLIKTCHENESIQIRTIDKEGIAFYSV